MAHTTSRAPLAAPPVAASAGRDTAPDLDAYVPARVRERIEQTYYARVSEQATLDRLAYDAAFLDDPGAHAALFSDHGIVHMRDVAARLLAVLDTMHGVCIPPRTHERLEGFMKSYGVMLAYLHDIGMADLSPLGRAAHAAFVAQAVFTPALDEVVEAVWAANSGAIPERLRDLAARGALAQDPSTVWREMLALAMAHSKSCVPRAVLDRPARLRRTMLATLGSDLRTRYGGRRRGQMPCEVRVPDGAGPNPVDLDALAAQLPRALRRFYADPEREPFGWLVGAHPAVRELVDDVVDTARALRCADALRQRGTALKTSGAYEVFVDRLTAEAVYALRQGPDRVFLLRLADPLAAGEANVAHSMLSRAGDLHIGFHRGAFADPAAVACAAAYAAAVVDDIQSDVLGSFSWPRRRRPGPRGDGRGGVPAMHVVLEGVADNPAFAGLVSAQLRRRNPRLRGRVRTTPSAPGVAADRSWAEEARYGAAPVLDWDDARRQAALERIASRGQRVSAVDPVAGFRGAKVVTLQAGETLIEAGTPAAFVYIPLEDGLTVQPLGGYPPVTIDAWVPVGHTGVIRGASRNATVIARRTLALLTVPHDVYLRWWHRPYSATELRSRLR